MNLLEYEAKQLLTEFSIPTPRGVVVHRDDINRTAGTPIPTVLKSQVPTGGRGKLGGIRVVEDPKTVDAVAKELFALPIKSYLPQTLLAEEKLSIAKEFYFSILIDRATSAIRIIAHPQGGVEVEDNNTSEFLTVAISPDTFNTAGSQLAELYDIPEQTFVLQDLVKNSYECFVKNDATLLEINPLVLTQDNHLVAGDCKMSLDSAAAFRHPAWNFEQKKTEANFVTLDPHGTVATIANGAGLAMATVDAVADKGMAPANFLDVGGGASTESVLAAFTRIMEYTNVRAIVINIFAGITRCDEVAKAIIQAKKQFHNLPPLCIRLAGTNYEYAAELLAAENILLMSTLDDCLIRAKEYVK